MMNQIEALAELEARGSSQTRKTFARHGVGPNQFGVLFADLGKLARRIGRDHTLALALWQTGNHDARMLAARVADPAQMDSALLESWVNDLDNYVITDEFSDAARNAPAAAEKMTVWMQSGREWVGRAGWRLLAHQAMNAPDLPDDLFARWLPVIEQTIHTAPNRTRDAMNSALIAIGIRNEALRQQAMASAERIGKVVVDHGQTSCKTPDAAGYILKTLEHRRQMAARRKEKKA